MRIDELWRYPVKSMGGERVSSVAVSERGLSGDRAFAVADRASAKILSAKRHPALLEASASCRASGDVVVTLPDGTTGAAGAGELDGALSAWLGFDVGLVPAREGVVSRFDMESDLDDPSRLVELRTAPGLFFDSRSPVHVLTRSSLAEAADGHPAGRWSIARFRPNIVVAGAAPGFVEDTWIDATLAAGDAMLWVRKPCDRCVVVTRAQRDLPRDLDVLRSLRPRDLMLGVLAHPVGTGRLTIGDEITVVETTVRAVLA